MSNVAFTINVVLECKPELQSVLNIIAGAVASGQTFVTGKEPVKIPVTVPEKPVEVEKPAAEAPEIKAEKPEIKDEKPEIKGKKAEITIQDVRDAMKAIRDRFEYGECAPGEVKGPNETQDKTIHKQLTALFIQTANEIEEGHKPSELTPENREIFITRIEGTTLVDGTYVAPF